MLEVQAPVVASTYSGLANGIEDADGGGGESVAFALHIIAMDGGDLGFAQGIGGAFGGLGFPTLRRLGQEGEEFLKVGWLGHETGLVLRGSGEREPGAAEKDRAERANTESVLSHGCNLQ